jgi:hypothetical protein
MCVRIVVFVFWESFSIASLGLIGQRVQSKELDAHPVNLGGRCATIRFRGRKNDFSVKEAADLLRSRRTPIHIGLAFVEWPFVSFSDDGLFHFYHFLEFLVVAYAELHLLGRDAIVSIVPWIYVPLMTVDEVCGGATRMNCLVANLVLSRNTHHNISIHGLESNDYVTRSIGPAFAGTDDRRKTPWQTYAVTDTAYHHMVAEADAVLLLHRKSCKDESINKMWGLHIDSFPAQRWHADILQGLGLTASDESSTERKKLIVGYVDRQNAKRALPKAFSQWLVRYLGSHPQIDFQHLRMEDLSPVQQLQIACQCHVWMGGHGNGLSHILWMKPGSYVAEFFWNYDFQFDYATAAQLMGHHYMGLYNGAVIAEARLTGRDPTLRNQGHDPVNVHAESIKEQIRHAREATTHFLEEAISDLNIG